MKEIIEFIIAIARDLGFPLDENAIYFILGFLLPLVFRLFWITTGKPIYRKSSNFFHIKRAKSVFQLVENKLNQISYFPIYPNIDIKDSPTIRTHISIKRKPELIRFSPNIIDVKKTIDEFLTSVKKIKKNDPLYLNLFNQLNQRIADANFATEDEFEPDKIDEKEYKVFKKLLEDKINLGEAKKKVLFDFLSGSSGGNGYLHNGRLFALLDFSQSKDKNESEELYITLQETDYYSYRIIAGLSNKIILEYGLKDYLGNTANYLLEYLPNFQKNIHLSLGVGIIMHTYKDNRIIITRRSANAAQNVSEAGKYFMSVCEGINNNDADGDNKSHLQPLLEIVYRSIREEIYGGKDNTNLNALIKKCVITGSFLYLPNMSIELCFYVGINCSSADIRHSYHLAKDSGLETSEIINEKKWDKKTGLPKFNPKSIYNFINKTIIQNDISKTWDQGAITTLMLSAYVEDEYYQKYK